MIVRAVSNLPSVESKGLGVDDPEVRASLIELSKPITGLTDKYASYNIRLSSISDGISSILHRKLVDQFDLIAPNGSNISLSSQVARIDNLYNGDLTYNGIKEFKKYPYISASFPTDMTPYGTEDNIIPNVFKVKNIMRQQNPGLVSTTSSYITDGCPFRDPVTNNPIVNNTRISFENSVGVSNKSFYLWNISTNKRDSSQTVWDETSITRDDYEEMRDSGYLVVWGWVADKGTVNAEDCWVGIFTTMKYEGSKQDEMIEVPLQIQPWIKGTHSSSLQYVGFNIPVKKGLRLKIKTGFPVGGASGGDFQKGNTLTFVDRYIPNTFFGYVIHND